VSPTYHAERLAHGLEEGTEQPQPPRHQVQEEHCAISHSSSTTSTISEDKKLCSLFISFKRG
jgi:hypothetical protein